MCGRAAGDALKAVETVQSADPSGEAQYWDALRCIRGGDPAAQELGRRSLQESADREFAPAQVMLGDCLESAAVGFSRDLRRSAGLFRLAAERGNGFGMVRLGRSLLTGRGVGRDEPLAVRWLTRAVDAATVYPRLVPPKGWAESIPTRPGGHQMEELAGRIEGDPEAGARATAHFLLGLVAERHNEEAVALAHFVEAANAGVGGRAGLYEAAVKAAVGYAFGRGAPSNLTRANTLLEHAKQLERRSGFAGIRTEVETGRTDEFAVSDLEQLITEKSDEESAQLQFCIAMGMADRNSESYNPREALKWCELAAESGQTWAMLSLAYIYSEGSLGPPDAAKAFVWFEKVGGGERPRHWLGVAPSARP